jgi:hypothetical protein
VLAERTLLADMGVLSDPFARAMLSPSWTAFVAIVSHWPYRVRPWSVARAGLAARVLWHDAQVAKALDAGIRQVAVIGAGYDSRAWRFRRDGVRFFELDHGTTQQDKVRRAPGPGTPQDRRHMGFQRLARTGSGEKLRLLVDHPRAVELVEESGWDVTEAASMREAARALVSRASGLPIEAINEHKTLVAGVRS